MYSVPTFIELPRDHGPHDESFGDVWYVASVVRSGSDEFGVLAVFVAGRMTGAPGQMMVELAVTHRGSGRSIRSSSTVEADQVSRAADSLDVRTPDATLVGDLSHFELTANLSGQKLALELSGNQVLYNAGTGLWPWVSSGSTTYQFSVPNVDAKGTLTFDGQTYDVAGGSWYDRQWIMTAERPKTFQWMGICLDNGHAFGMFELTGCEKGGSWLTCRRPEGTHIVASAPSFREAAKAAQSLPEQDPPAHWNLTLEALDADLRIGMYKLLENSEEGRTGYTGVLAVEGSMGGTDVSGYGFTDVGSSDPS